MASLRRGRMRSLRAPACIVLATCVLVLLAGLPATSSQAYEPWWVQNHTETDLWSGPDEHAISFGRLPQWSYLQVVAPQDGPRLYVLNPATRGYAFVDAVAVGPSSAPPVRPDPAEAPGSPPGADPSEPTPSTPPAPHEPWWVSNFEETELWAGPEPGAPSLGHQRQFKRFQVLAPQEGSRLKVWSPESDLVGYVDAAVVGPSGPSIWLKPITPKQGSPVNLPGRSLGDRTFVRSMPVVDDESALRKIPHNSPVHVFETVLGDDGQAWYRIGDGEYLLGREVRLPRVLSQARPGKWIHVDLAEPAMFTAYEDGRIVYTGLTIKGVAAFSTPKGTFQISRRVEDETMDSLTLHPPIPRDHPQGYYLKNVLYTQYFTADGASFHYNYWVGTFGYPGSHGCLGLNYQDSKWLWDWATLGTPVVIE